jgi:hypothetical protein
MNGVDRGLDFLTVTEYVLRFGGGLSSLWSLRTSGRKEEELMFSTTCTQVYHILYTPYAHVTSPTPPLPDSFQSPGYSSTYTHSLNPLGHGPGGEPFLAVPPPNKGIGHLNRSN